MFGRLADKLKFRLERWIQRGWIHQLAAVIALIALISVFAGIVVFVLTDAFSRLAPAVWWAFLRLSDPGYLGDDEGTILRTVSTFVTVAGYVVFLGALVAIMTQWLDRKIAALESGLTPIAASNHIAILGWTNRTPDIVRELAFSKGRVRRFMRRRNVRNLRIVVLAQQVNAARTQELKEHLDEEWDNHDIVLRSGTSLVPDHLRRVDAARASALILPGTDYELGGAENSDARVIKSLMTLDGLLEETEGDRPSIVSEILDADKISIARQAAEDDLEVLASDLTIARLIAQNTRHEGLSVIYEELLSHARGNEIYLEPAGDLDGQTFEAAAGQFPQATLIGALRPAADGFRSFLNPGLDFELAPDDRLVLIAPGYDETRPQSTGEAPTASSGEIEPASEPADKPSFASTRRVLLLGWNHKVRPLLSEYNSYARERFQIDILSTVSTAERQAELARVDFGDRVQLTQIDGDYTREADLRAVDPASYDNVVFLSSERFRSEEETDARTIVGYMLLHKLLEAHASRPDILVELMDPDNTDLLSDRDGEVIVSPKIISHMLAHVALRPELSVVFGELFGPGGAEIFSRSPAYYGLSAQSLSFRALQRVVDRHGEILMGVRTKSSEGGGDVHLNPPNTSPWTLSPNDELIVLATY